MERNGNNLYESALNLTERIIIIYTTFQIISSNTSVLSPYSMDDNITSIAPMITTTALTSHDLAKMFPTPPSIEESVMHQTMSPSNIDNHMTYVHSTMLLSPADSGRGNSSEDFYNLRSPAMVQFF